MYACKMNVAGISSQAMAERTFIQMVLLRILAHSLIRQVHALQYGCLQPLFSAVDHLGSSSDPSFASSLIFCPENDIDLRVRRATPVHRAGESRVISRRTYPFDIYWSMREYPDAVL